ncbi:hypothetical protein DNTS_025245 [Danionella cerebrum]|uniref:Ig-like domain-containing protein n=1 Tax=Danionella cerebrum TaxID=2873325 RepID=A0A553RC05_9TELE|nr:hypothetical protein DNTS_025245 [Danionella translucida]
MRALSLKTLDRVAVREGGNVTIPCFYDAQYELNSKYWCRGDSWMTCEMLARANHTGRWRITDSPALGSFTASLTDASSSDSGTYWCAVDSSDMNPPDRQPLYLSVQADPDLFVMISSLSAEEGGTVSVQCFYSQGYKNKAKRWCRVKDQTCFEKLKTEESSQDSSVQIHNNQKSRSFTVEMSGLRLSDSGWFFCSAGDLQVPVHLTVARAKAGALSLKTLDTVAVREGGNVTIPCFYDAQYELNSKYWCQGFYWIFCEILARANHTGRWRVTDSPAHGSFTASLTDASSSDSGTYWCAVEIGSRASNSDKRKYLNLKVQKAVSLLKRGILSASSVSTAIKTSRKQSAERSCYEAGKTSSQNSSILITDDWKRSFTVEMSGLRLSDSGWFFCSAGDLQVPVHLTVARAKAEKGADVRSRAQSDGGVAYDIVYFKKTTDKEQISIRCPPEQDVIYSVIEILELSQLAQISLADLHDAIVLKEDGQDMERMGRRLIVFGKTDDRDKKWVGLKTDGE